MQYHGFVSKFDDGLWYTEGQWPQPRSKPSNKNSAFMSIISLSLYFKTSKSESNPLTDSHNLQWEKNKSIEKLLVIFYPVWHFNKHKGGFPCYNNGGVS